MKRIVFLSNPGMNASLMVTRMREESRRERYDCEIRACSMEQMKSLPEPIDLILVEPQMRFTMKRTASSFTDVPILYLDNKVYNALDGKQAFTLVMKQFDTAA